MEQVESAIIGAGVIGLAIGAELSRHSNSIVILEKNPSFGQETSSRNSEVIHGGMYYPKESLKAKACIEGRRLLYDFCAAYKVPHKKTGKLIVATNRGEVADLEAIFTRGRENGVEGLHMLSPVEIKPFEPHIDAVAAVYSPETGILDTHSYMKTLEGHCKERGVSIAYSAEVTGIEKAAAGYELCVRQADGERLTLSSRIVINCAGLSSDRVAGFAGIADDSYRLKYCKGDYFRLNAVKAGSITRLIYPVPRKEDAGLGIHATPDMAGGVRLGPDDQYVDGLDYSVDAGKQRAFFESARAFLPFITYEDLSPDMSGIRPKLQGRGEGFRDFIIREESTRGLPGLINLVGIESPGLTGSLAIARLVKKEISSLLD